MLDGRVFKVRKDVTINPRTGVPHDMFVLEQPNWVNVIPLTPDDHVVMIEQWRHGTRTVEFYHIYPAPHSNALLIAYIPQEKVLFQGDFSVNPGQPANYHVKALVPAVAKLGLDYQRYINVHVSAAPQTKADVTAAMAAR